MKIDAGEHAVSIELHQSDLETYLTCPERARQLWLGGVASLPNERAAVGTAVHAGIEAYQNGAHRYDAHADALHVFEQLTAEPGFRWVKTSRYDTCVRHITTAFDAWLERVWPTLDVPIAVEPEFHLPWGEPVEIPDRLGEFSEVHVTVAGRMDHVDPSGVRDYKVTTHGYKYDPRFGGEGWKLKRWGIQATVYTWAARQLGLIGPSDAPVCFEWIALHPTTGQVQRMECERSEAHWAWLDELIWNVVGMVLADMPQWPLNDQHALCSELWCPAWDRCKGAAVEGLALAA